MEKLCIQAFVFMTKFKEICDNLTKFLWVKNYTKTYKNKRNINYDIRKIRVYTREDCTAKIHEKMGKKSAKEFQPVT